MKMKLVRDRILAAFFPQRCVLCNQVVAYRTIVCDDCKDEPLLKDIPCEYCGKDVYHCTCADKAYNLTDTFSAFDYGENVKSAVLRLKKIKIEEAFDYFARCIFATITSLRPELKFDSIVAVPMFHGDLVKRGYNQAEELAKRLSVLLMTPYYADILLKNYSHVQHEAANYKERIEAMKNLYSVSPAANIKGKTILLVDDVVTTGATINICKKLLLTMGASKVYAATIAATRRK